MFGGIRSSTWAIQFSASASSRRPLRRDLPEPQAGGGTGPLRETLLHVRGERNQGAATCSPTGRRPRPCSPAPLLCDFRQHFGGGVSETRPRRHRGRQGPRSGEVPQGCRPHLRVQGSALVFFDLRRNCSPGSWRTCGRRRRRRRSAVRGSGGPPPKAGATELACSRSLPCIVVAVRKHECSSFVQKRAHDSPAGPGFQTADRPENRADNPDPASGSGEISGLEPRVSRAAGKAASRPSGLEPADYRQRAGIAPPAQEA